MFRRKNAESHRKPSSLQSTAGRSSRLSCSQQPFPSAPLHTFYFIEIELEAIFSLRGDDLLLLDRMVHNPGDGAL